MLTWKWTAAQVRRFVNKRLSLWLSSCYHFCDWICPQIFGPEIGIGRTLTILYVLSRSWTSWPPPLNSKARGHYTTPFCEPRDKFWMSSVYSLVAWEQSNDPAKNPQKLVAAWLIIQLASNTTEAILLISSLFLFFSSNLSNPFHFCQKLVHLLVCAAAQILKRIEKNKYNLMWFWMRSHLPNLDIASSPIRQKALSCMSKDLTMCSLLAESLAWQCGRASGAPLHTSRRSEQFEARLVSQLFHQLVHSLLLAFLGRKETNPRDNDSEKEQTPLFWERGAMRGAVVKDLTLWFFLEEVEKDVSLCVYVCVCVCLPFCSFLGWVGC